MYLAGIAEWIKAQALSNRKRVCDSFESRGFESLSRRHLKPSYRARFELSLAKMYSFFMFLTNY